MERTRSTYQHIGSSPTELPTRGDQDLDLHDYLRVLRRGWMLVVLCCLLGLLGGGAAALLIKPTYTADTQLFVAIQGSGTVSELQQGNTFSQARVQSYVKTVKSPIVLQPVIDRLGLQITANELSQRVVPSADLNTVLINISVSDSSPVQAAAIAQGVASSLIQVVDNLEKPEKGGTSPVRLSVIAPAAAPQSPSAPNTRVNILLGLLGGLVIGVGSAFVRSLLDTRVRGDAEVRQVTDASVLGGIAMDSESSKRPLLTQAEHQSPRAESFRQIRTNLQFANVAGKAKTVLLTSSVPGEGKSTTATNLAIALSQAGQTVCLVDADLRRPMVHDYLGLDRNAGLTTALVGAAEVNDLLQPWGDDNLYVLTSGQIPPNPSELLGSEQMRSLIEKLESVFDTVIIDSPPLLPVTDAAVLAQYVGGVVIVISSQQVKITELKKSFIAMEMVGANILGVILNRLPIKGPDAYAHSYYSYTSHPAGVGRASKSNTSSRGRSRSAREYSTNPDAPPLSNLRDARSFSEQMARRQTRN